MTRTENVLPSDESAPPGGAPDPETADRMRKAVQRAQVLLRLAADSGVRRWGWAGRSLGVPIRGDSWLRVASAPIDREPQQHWLGAATAHAALPSGVPRPRLTRTTRWKADDWVFHAQVFMRTPSALSSNRLLPPGAAPMPTAWWEALRDALALVASTRTARLSVTSPELMRLVRDKFRVTVPFTRLTWSASHGDLIWSNLTGPRLQLLDWERWGMAPEGWDSAVLYTSCLDQPHVAADILRAFPRLQHRDSRAVLLGAAAVWQQQIDAAGHHRSLRRPLVELANQLLASPDASWDMR